VAPLRHDLKLLSGRFIPTLPADVAAVVPSFYIAALLPPRMLEVLASTSQAPVVHGGDSLDPDTFPVLDMGGF
jgi:hypothetical protein